MEILVFIFIFCSLLAIAESLWEIIEAPIFYSDDEVENEDK